MQLMMELAALAKLASRPVTTGAPAPTDKFVDFLRLFETTEDPATRSLPNGTDDPQQETSDEAQGSEIADEVTTDRRPEDAQESVFLLPPLANARIDVPSTDWSRHGLAEAPPEDPVRLKDVAAQQIPPDPSLPVNLTDEAQVPRAQAPTLEVVQSRTISVPVGHIRTLPIAELGEITDPEPATQATGSEKTADMAAAKTIPEKLSASDDLRERGDEAAWLPRARSLLNDRSPGTSGKRQLPGPQPHVETAQHAPQSQLPLPAAPGTIPVPSRPLRPMTIPMETDQPVNIGGPLMNRFSGDRFLASSGPVPIKGARLSFSPDRAPDDLSQEPMPQASRSTPPPPPSPEPDGPPERRAGPTPDRVPTRETSVVPTATTERGPAPVGPQPSRRDMLAKQEINSASSTSADPRTIRTIAQVPPEHVLFTSHAVDDDGKLIPGVPTVQAMLHPASSSAQRPLGHSATVPPAVSQAAAAIANTRTEDGIARTEITLSPEELGRLKVEIITKDDGVTIRLVADRADTADLLRRQSDVLMSELRQAGITNANLTFGDKGHHGQGQQGQGQDSDETKLPELPSAPSLPGHSTRADGRLHLRL